MANMLQKGAQWLSGKRHAHMTIAVVYRRGTESTELLATIGKTEWDQADEFGIVRRFESRDFLVRSADLILGGVTVQPEAGDQVVETALGGSLVYEVMAPGGAPPWRYSDTYRSTIRVHTKHVGSAV